MMGAVLKRGYGMLRLAPTAAATSKRAHEPKFQRCARVRARVSVEHASPHARVVAAATPLCFRFVIKRDKSREPVHFDKITVRIQRLCEDLEDNVDAVRGAAEMPQ